MLLPPYTASNESQRGALQAGRRGKLPALLEDLLEHKDAET